MSEVCGFSVLLIEYERGWGSKPGGYLIFPSEMAADLFIKGKYIDRGGVAPDYYVNYNKVGWIPITKKEQAKMKKYGRVYRD